VKEKDPDGNCLYRALGDYPQGAKGSPRCIQLRNTLAKYQKDNPNMQVFGTGAVNSTFEEYVLDEMKENLDHYAF
jgi:hypothetical protein